MSDRFETVPVEVDQIRKGQFGNVWGVLHPHATRRGFWIVVNSDFPYTTISLGRRQIESMPLMRDDYFPDGHPGIRYCRSLQAAIRSTGRSDR